MDKELLDAIGTLLDSRLKPIEDRLKNIEERSTKTEIVLENDIATQLKLIYEGYAGLNEKVVGSVINKEAIDDTTDRVSTLEAVVKKHSTDIKDLKKKIG